MLNVETRWSVNAPVYQVTLINITWIQLNIHAVGHGTEAQLGSLWVRWNEGIQKENI